jgi:hypothetical protein
MDLLNNYDRVIDQHIHQGTLQHDIGQICWDALLQAMEATPNLGKYRTGSLGGGVTAAYPSVQSEAIKKLEIPLDMNSGHSAPEPPGQYDTSEELDFQLNFCLQDSLDGENTFSLQPSLSQGSAKHNFFIPESTSGIGCPSSEQSIVPPCEHTQNGIIGSNFVSLCGSPSEINFQDSTQSLDDTLAHFDFRAVEFLGSVSFSQSQDEQGEPPSAVAGLDGYHLDSEFNFEKDGLGAHLAEDNNIPIPVPAGPFKDKNIGNRFLHKHSSIV